MKNLFIYSLLLYLLGGFELYAQPQTDRLMQILAASLRQFPEEKVYAVCDKPLYQPGEIVWFAGFVCNDSLMPTQTSDGLWAEWINPQGAVVQKLKCAVVQGVAQGEVLIPKESMGGIYTLRVYTWHQKNELNPYVFERKVQVQSVVLPRLKMTLNFGRKSYGQGDSLSAHLVLQRNDHELLRNHPLEFTLKIEGKEVATFPAITDGEGKCTLRCTLPPTLNRPDGLLIAKIPFEGQTESISRSIPIVLNQIDMTFYPEGGNLIAGLPNRVAFQARNEFGKPADIKGYLADDKGNKLVAFTSFHQGMGAFEWTPLAENYKVYLTHPTTAIFSLPAVQEKGHTLSIRENHEALEVTIHSQEKEPLRLVAFFQGKPQWDTSFVAKRGSNTLHFSVPSLPMGILQFTLFDKKAIPQAERLCFIHYNRQMNIEMTTEKTQYETREKVTIHIQTKDEAGKPIPAQLALSVANDKLLTFADDKSATILSELLLQNDIKTPIAEPQFYFDIREAKSKRTHALDLLLMTAGWRRYTWKQIAELPPSPSTIFLPDKAQSYAPTGKVVEKGTQKPVFHARVILDAVDTVFTDAKGVFSFTRYIKPTISHSLEIDKDNMHYTGKLAPYYSVYSLHASPNATTSHVNGMVQGSIKRKDGSPAPYVTVTLLQNGQAVNGTYADEEGNYSIPQVVPGEYEVVLESLEDGNTRLPYITVAQGQIMELPLRLGLKYTPLPPSPQKPPIQTVAPPSILTEILPLAPPQEAAIPQDVVVQREEKNNFIIEEVEDNTELRTAEVTITEWVVPAFEKDASAQAMIVSGENMRGRATRDIKSIVASAPGVYQQDEGDEELSIRGSRPGGTVYIVDGVKVRGIPSIPQSAIKNMAVYTGGTPAEFGDFTGGVVVIETRSSSPWDRPVNRAATSGGTLQIGERKPLPQQVLPPYHAGYHMVKEFPSPVYETPTFMDTKDDFRSTLYWNGHITTNTEGKASISFYTSDENTSFVAKAEGISHAGRVGQGSATFFVQNSISVEAKLPIELVVGDTLQMPITVANHTDEVQMGKFAVQIPQHIMQMREITGVKWEMIGKTPFVQVLSLQPKEVLTIYVTIVPLKASPSAHISLHWIGKGKREGWEKTLKIQDRGFPEVQTFSGSDKENAYVLSLSDRHISGTERVEVSVYTSLLSEITSGIEGMLQEPHGCFEQTSSTTYPNVLVLQLLKNTASPLLGVEEKARGYIQKGYDRLVGFECKNGGFEWFGRDPGHEALTAYGLMEFQDIKNMGFAVSTQMIERTQKWLLDKRDGNGGFQSSKVSSSFGASEKASRNAYITWALSETHQTGIDKEIAACVSAALESNSPYLKALTANILLNEKREPEALALIRQIMDVQSEDGGFSFKEEGNYFSAVGSQGQGLSLETAGLTLFAALKFQQKDEALIEELVKYIRKSKNGYGYYGNTQSTVLCLKALAQYATHIQEKATKGNVRVEIEGKQVANIPFLSRMEGEKKCDSLERYLRSAPTHVKIAIDTEDKVGVPHTLRFAYQVHTPPTHPSCKIALTTSLSTGHTTVGETVRLTAVLQNTSDKPQAMTLARIQLPAGLTAQPWQLKELQENKIVDFYETKGNEIVCYYRELAPNQQRMIVLDLKAEVSGTFQSAAASAYPYYTAEQRYWTRGLDITIAP